jgi:uncharacterized protein with HEPN domain
MPPTVEDRLRDILEAITEIEGLVANGSLVQFTADKTGRMGPNAISRLSVRRREG